ncbi:MAG: glycosyltransferase involved in cell wall biosynthesis [Halieaceae bacterium]
MPRQKIQKLCVFGGYDDSEFYSRNRSLIDALAACSEEVVEVRPNRKQKGVSNHQRLASAGKLFSTAFGVAGDFLSLVQQMKKLSGADCYFVPYPAYLDVLLLQWLTTSSGRPAIIVDAFLCLHDTLVNDRKILAPKGIFARMAAWLERRTLLAADLVFIDTEQQKSLLLEKYGLELHKIAVIPVGIDETLWRPLPVLPYIDNFKLLFWGTFIPLHGVDTIILAAQQLQFSHPHIKIELIGDGQTADASASLIKDLKLSNITWQRSLLPALRLRAEVEAAHCVLGVFGESDKAGNVIPYKAYQAMACNKILLNREGAAMSALLGDEDVCGMILVPPADPIALARAITEVADSYTENYAGVTTRVLYDRYLSNETVLKRVRDEVELL